ncbi:MAG: homocysteine S-methyltransferase family protein [bacterium]
MKPKISELVKTGKILVSDGAWGTMLQAKGLEIGSCPELWNLTNSDDVFDVAKSYINAGADLIETNSFGGSSIKLADYNLQNQAFEINKKAVEISKKAAGQNNYVIASMGPTGKFIFTGDVTEEELYNSFKEQALAFKVGGADAVCIETFYAVDEAVCAIKAVKENTDLEIICTFTFEVKANGEFRTMMGVNAEEMINAIVPLGVDIIGTNCGNGFADMVEIVNEFRKFNSSIPILVHANAGLPEILDGNLVYPETPEKIKEIIPKLIKAGANIIGGCCGTTPKHIAEIAKIVNGL